MAMERLEKVLREKGNIRDKTIADGIEVFRKLRGSDIPITVFLGLEGAQQVLSTKMPLYQRVALAVREKILSGEYVFDTPIPSESDLVKEHGVSRGTIREAMRILEEEGLLERKQGRATFVTFH